MKARPLSTCLAALTACVTPQLASPAAHAGSGPAGGGDGLASRSLSVSHVAQSENWNCGPASGVMIARTIGATTSAANGASLNQDHMGGPAHMQTDANHVTAWSSGLFRIGLNKWISGSATGFYIDEQTPSNADFHAALRYDIGLEAHPFGSSALSSLWANATNTFTATTNSFNASWVSPHGITW